MWWAWWSWQRKKAWLRAAQNPKVARVVNTSENSCRRQAERLSAQACFLFANSILPSACRKEVGKLFLSWQRWCDPFPSRRRLPAFHLKLRCVSSTQQLLLPLQSRHVIRR